MTSLEHMLQVTACVSSMTTVYVSARLTTLRSAPRTDFSLIRLRTEWIFSGSRNCGPTISKSNATFIYPSHLIFNFLNPNWSPSVVFRDMYISQPQCKFKAALLQILRTVPSGCSQATAAI